MRSLAMVSLALAMASCGASGESNEPTEAELAALCAGAPRQNADGSVTTLACAFEQQLNNMQTYGRALTPHPLYDADGMSLATVSMACDAWLAGSDAEGVTVTINTSTGKILSHGMLHPGQATSLLPATGKLPFQER
jgi:hypothetical protein